MPRRGYGKSPIQCEVCGGNLTHAENKTLVSRKASGTPRFVCSKVKCQRVWKYDHNSIVERWPDSEQREFYTAHSAARYQRGYSSAKRVSMTTLIEEGEVGRPSMMSVEGLTWLSNEVKAAGEGRNKIGFIRGLSRKAMAHSDARAMFGGAKAEAIESWIRRYVRDENNRHVAELTQKAIESVEQPVVIEPVYASQAGKRTVDTPDAEKARCVSYWNIITSQIGMLADHGKSDVLKGVMELLHAEVVKL